MVGLMFEVEGLDMIVMYSHERLSIAEQQILTCLCTLNRKTPKNLKI